MLVTVTANTTLDQTVYVPELTIGKTLRASKTVQSMAGKPTDAAWILAKLGIPSLALGFAAGAIGERIKAMLQGRGIQTDFVAVGGESRMNSVIIDEATGSHTTITTSTLVVEDGHRAALRQKYIAALDKATCIVLGGTLPQAVDPSFYTEFIGLAHERKIPTIFDADEPNLSAGLQGMPTYVKPNEHELARLVGYEIDSLDAAYRAGHAIQQKHGVCPIITLGERGILAVLDDRTYHCPAIPVDVVSPAGAGDGVLAGLAHAILAGNPIENGLSMGIAFATAVLLQPGTAAYEVADMERFLPQVELKSYPA